MTIREARDTLENLIFEFAWLLDHGRAVQALDLFCNDLKFGIEGKMVGRAELSTQLGARNPAHFVARHKLSNARITSVDRDTIQATMTATIYKIEANEGSPRTVHLCSDWHIRVEREGERWLLNSILVAPVALQDPHFN